MAYTTCPSTQYDTKRAHQLKTSRPSPAVRQHAVHFLPQQTARGSFGAAGMAAARDVVEGGREVGRPQGPNQPRPGISFRFQFFFPSRWYCFDTETFSSPPVMPCVVVLWEGESEGPEGKPARKKTPGPRSRIGPLD